MQVKLTTDGTTINTKVANAETGELITDLVAVRFNIDAREDEIVFPLTLVFQMAKVELESPANREYECEGCRLIISDRVVVLKTPEGETHTIKRLPAEESSQQSSEEDA